MRWGRIVRSLIVASLVSAACPPVAVADEIEVQLVGFLVHLRSPGGGVRLAELDVPNEQGGARVGFEIEITPRTSLAVAGGRLRPGELVVLEGWLAAGRVRAHRIVDVRVVELPGRFLLPDGRLALPLADDRLVQFAVDGSVAPLVFLLLRGAGVAPVRDRQPVTLGVVSGTRLIVGVDAR